MPSLLNARSQAVMMPKRLMANRAAARRYVKPSSLMHCKTAIFNFSSYA